MNIISNSEIAMNIISHSEIAMNIISNSEIGLAVIYNSSFWESIFNPSVHNPKVFLYKDGNECNSVTGGWDIISPVTSSHRAAIIEKNSNNITFNLYRGSTHGNGHVITKRNITQNNFKRMGAKVIINYTGVSNDMNGIAQIYINSNDDSNLLKLTSTNNNSEIQYLNLSNLTSGKSRFLVWNSNNTSTGVIINATLEQLWIEKEL